MGVQTSESRERRPSFALPSACSLPSLCSPPPASLPNTHSFIPQTTYKPPICPDHTAPLPSSALGDNGRPTPILSGPTPKPNYHLGTSGAGGGGIDLHFCLEVSWAQKACFLLDIKGQEQIRDPQLSRTLVLSTPPPIFGPRLLGQGRRQDGGDPLCSSVLQGTVKGWRKGQTQTALRCRSRRTPQEEHWARSQKTRISFGCADCLHSPGHPSGLRFCVRVGKREDSCSLRCLSL